MTLILKPFAGRINLGFGSLSFILLWIVAGATIAIAQPAQRAPAPSANLEITGAQVRLFPDLGLLVFEQVVAGKAGATVPEAAGQLDGAPVLGHVFPTTLAPENVGFAPGEGIVALAITSHPDFDDTPLWDESGDRDYTNDGVVFHSHWVVLVPDNRVDGGLAVKEAKVIAQELPPTSPGMPIYLDSPGFSVRMVSNTLQVLVPLDRVGSRSDFKYDAVTAYMEVNQSDPNRPMLGVYKVYHVLSGDLSLPFSISTTEPR